MIKISHGDVSDYAKLGTLAGQAKAATAAVERQATLDRQIMQIQAQRASQAQAQAHQKEMAEFDSYMDNIRYQSAEAWELEKMELRSRHDFEMLESKREMDFMSEIQREQRQKQEMDMKLKAISEAEHLSDREKEIATLRVQTGVGVQADRPAGKQSLFGSVYADIQQKKLDEVRRTGVEVKRPDKDLSPELRAARDEADRTKNLRAETALKVKDIKAILPKLSEEEQIDLRRVIASQDPVEIDKAHRLLESEISPSKTRYHKTRYQKFAFGG